MAIRVGGTDGGSFRRRKRNTRIVRGQAAKPFRPIENPFPQKEEFRLGTYRIIEEKDDYLICEGYDPLAKNPASEYTPSAPRPVKVAKPSLLLKTPWDGETVTIKGLDYTYEYTDIGERTVTWTDENGDGQEEDQRIVTPYFEGDIIVAVEVARNPWQDGMEVNDEKVKDEDGAIISWVDLNVSGRDWSTAVDTPCTLVHELYIDGNPTSGSHSYDYTIDGVTDTLVFDYNNTATDVSNTLLAASLGLTSDDFTVLGGPLPNVAIYIEWSSEYRTLVSWPPVQSGVTLNNSAALKLRKAGG